MLFAMFCCPCATFEFNFILHANFPIHSGTIHILITFSNFLLVRASIHDALVAARTIAAKILDTSCEAC